MPSGACFPSFVLMLALAGAPAVAAAQPAPAPDATAAPVASARVFDGRAGDLVVDPPRVDTSVTVDGLLDEPVWSQAARLSGCSRDAPVVGAPAGEP
ncbi:MAG: hypothetical protein AB7N90_13265, partial [Vicinamibacterales bacterium]